MVVAVAVPAAAVLVMIRDETVPICAVTKKLTYLLVPAFVKHSSALYIAVMPTVTHYNALSVASLCCCNGPARYPVWQYTTACVSFCSPHRVLCCYLIDFLCWEVRWLYIYVSQGEIPVPYRRTDTLKRFVRNLVFCRKCHVFNIAEFLCNSKYLSGSLAVI